MAEKLLEIPVKSIREGADALRSVNRNSEDYMNVRDSIKARGVLNPILVMEGEKENGQQLYNIIDGLHRYTGAVDAGLDTIPAKVIAPKNRSEILEAQLIANANKVDTKPTQYTQHLKQILVENPTLSLEQFAARLSRSREWLTQRLTLSDLTPAIKTLVDEGKIKLSNAFLLAKLPEDVQGDFTERAMVMSPAEFGPNVLARRNEIAKAKRTGREAGPAVFIPVAHLQKMSVLKGEIDNPTLGPILCRESNLPAGADAGFKLGVQWAVHLDPRSVDEAKAKDAARKAKEQEERKKAAAERAQKKAEAAAKAAMDAGAVKS